MRRMSAGQIRDSFNAQKEKFQKEHAQSGLLDALGNLSLAIADIQAEGHDVSLQIFGNPSEQAFAMFPRGGGLTTPVSGILRIGRNERLLAISTKVGGAPALQLAVSDFDIRFNGTEGKLKEGDIGNSIRAKIFDLKNDPEALVKFQKDVLYHGARNSAVDALDNAGAFDNNAKATKPKLKAPPKPLA